MTSSQKAKGSAWERSIVKAIKGFGLTLVGRNYGAGRPDDLGDIQLGLITIEAKNCVKLDLGGWLSEAEWEAENAGAPIGVVWHHRKGKASAEDGYVTMSGRSFMLLASASPLSGSAELGALRSWLQDREAEQQRRSALLEAEAAARPALGLPPSP